MAKTAARLNLERAYRILMDCQETNDQERQLRAAQGVIVAYEAVVDELTVRLKIEVQERVKAAIELGLLTATA